MERVKDIALIFFFVCLIALSFTAGLIWGIQHADAAEKRTRVVYPKKTKLDFDGLQLEGEIKNPAEFYFQHRPQDKFDSLVKARRNFHREMLRDAVLTK